MFDSVWVSQTELELYVPAACSASFLYLLLRNPTEQFFALNVSCFPGYCCVCLEEVLACIPRFVESRFGGLVLQSFNVKKFLRAKNAAEEKANFVASNLRRPLQMRAVRLQHEARVPLIWLIVQIGGQEGPVGFKIALSPFQVIASRGTVPRFWSYEGHYCVVFWAPSCA